MDFGTYGYWLGFGAPGAGLALLDILLFRRPWCGLLILALGLAGGAVIQLNPYAGGGTIDWDKGVLAVFASFGAAVGYALAGLPWVVLWLARKARSS